jgi:hypothetical protein
MQAFEIWLNGELLCTAGIGDHGVLSVMTDLCSGDGHVEFELRVGGLNSQSDEYVMWRNQKLKLGDEVCVKIVESESIDSPPDRRHRDHAKEAAREQRQSKRYVRDGEEIRLADRQPAPENRVTPGYSSSSSSPVLAAFAAAITFSACKAGTKS